MDKLIREARDKRMNKEFGALTDWMVLDVVFWGEWLRL